MPYAPACEAAGKAPASRSLLLVGRLRTIRSVEVADEVRLLCVGVGIAGTLVSPHAIPDPDPG